MVADNYRYEHKQIVNLPTADFLNLELHLLETRPGITPEAFLTGMVRRWLAVEMERAELRKNGVAIRGFQWQSVFMPHGTRLRTSYRATIDFAEVINDQIRSDDGRPLTPSLFANRYATGRNAWRFVWLRFPGDEHWVRASACRTRINMAAAP